MGRYIIFQLAQIAQGNEEGNPTLVIFLGTVLAAFRSHFDGFLYSNPIFWVSIFWALDWIMGSFVAIKNNNWSPRRGLYGVVKWLIWCVVLAVTWGIRDLGFLGSGLIGSTIEAAIILTEGSSILRHCAILSGNPRAKRLLNKFADATESKLQQIEERLNNVETETLKLESAESVRSTNEKKETDATNSSS